MPLSIKFTLFLLGLFFCLGSSPTIADAASYPEELSKRAAEMKLHEERGWEVLLHYVGRWNGGHTSTIDDANFFLAEDGRTDAGAELEATVKGMFVSGSKDGEHVACRFPARYEWLVDRLSIDESQVPAYSCSERDAELQAVEAKSAVLVFPVGHINSPASMFGHTLIRVDGSSRSNLLSHAVNYSAQTTDTNGFVYAWKGMTGMYKGYYSLMPYYQKVQEYNDLEHRDMWEYQLSLTELEVKRMLNHIWELHKISSPYYFMDQNCSYNLLFLLEAARPELHLTEKMGLLVLPTNTIQAVINSGIVSKVSYRPSQGTKLKKIISELDIDAQKKAHSIALGREKPESIADIVSVDDKMKMLDLAAGFVQYRFARGEMEKDAYSKLYLGVLAERSKLGVAPAVSEADEPKRPESGHDTAKIAVGGGVRRGRVFAELNLRPQFHGLVDPDAGYLRGAQIHFLDTKLRYSFPDSDFHLKSLHVVDIFSVAPRDTFFKPISWKVNTGLDYELLGTGKDHLIYRLNTGGGFSFSSPWGGIVYGLGEIDVNAGEKIPARVAVGSGVSVGYLEEVAGWWKCHLQLTGMLYKLGDDRQSLKASLGQNFRVSRNNSIELVVSSETVNEFHVSDAAILWKHFF